MLGRATLTTVLSSIAIARAKHMVRRTMTFSRALSPSKPNIEPPCDDGPGATGCNPAGRDVVPSGEPPIHPDRDRDEDHEEHRDPDHRREQQARQALGAVVGRQRRVPQREDASRVGPHRHRVVLRDRLDPRLHPRDRHQRRAHEHDREDPGEHRGLHALDLLDRERHHGGDPREDEADREHERDHPEGAEQPVLEAEPDEVADADHEDQQDEVLREIRRGAADEDGRSRHRQGPEPVDETLLHVLRETDRGRRRPEDRVLREDPRHQEHHVREARREVRDVPREHEGEQQHEHDRLHELEHEHGRDPRDLQEVPAHHDHAVGERVPHACRRSEAGRRRLERDAHRRSSPRDRPRRFGAAASWSCSCSAACPVRDRNTSSSVGRCRAMSASAMLPSSKRRTLSRSAEGPALPTGIRTLPASRSRVGSPVPIPSRISATFVVSPRSCTWSSSTSPPIWSFSSSDVPSAITVPRSITATRSARLSASSRYCVVSRMVLPSCTSSRIIAQRSMRLRGSSPVVGSSRNSTSGRATRLAATSNLRRIPPEYVFAWRPAASASPKRSRISMPRRRASAAGRWYSRPTISMFSRPVRFSSTAAACPASPIRLRRTSPSRTTSSPTTSALPLSGNNSVVRILTAVVLPAPLGPSKPKTVPVATSRSMPRNASTEPKFLTSPSTTIAPAIRTPYGVQRTSTHERSPNGRSV